MIVTFGDSIIHLPVCRHEEQYLATEEGDLKPTAGSNTGEGTAAQLLLIYLSHEKHIA